MPQVVYDGITHVSQQRQLYHLSRLLHRERNQVLVPVDVGELQVGYVRSPQPKTGCQQDHRIVALAGGTAARHGLLDSLHFFGSKVGRQAFRLMCLVGVKQLFKAAVDNRRNSLRYRR